MWIIPQARIKKIMQADEDVGKIAMAVPLLVCEWWISKTKSNCWNFFMKFLLGVHVNWVWFCLIWFQRRRWSYSYKIFATERMTLRCSGVQKPWALCICKHYYSSPPEILWFWVHGSAVMEDYREEGEGEREREIMDVLTYSLQMNWNLSIMIMSLSSAPMEDCKERKRWKSSTLCYACYIPSLCMSFW